MNPSPSSWSALRDRLPLFSSVLLLFLVSSFQAAPLTSDAASPPPGARDPGIGIRGLQVPSRAEASPGWSASINRQIAEAEYHVTWQSRTQIQGLAAALHAPNRSHGFRTYFTDRGIRVVPRTESPPSWEWGLELMGYGRERRWAPAEKPRLRPNENRITYDRGEIVEWFVNDQRGLEQGFTLAAPPEECGGWPKGPAAASPRQQAALPEPLEESADPAGSAGGADHGDPEGPLVLRMELTGDLHAFVSADGMAIDFVTPSGTRALRYSELIVVDATGRRLPARMEVASDSGRFWVRLVVEDKGASWPLTVDPVLTLAWTDESDQAFAWFGYSVNTAGDVNGDGFSDVIVGAPFFDNGDVDEGRVFLYFGSAGGVSAAADWTAESDQDSAHFGRSVGTAGDVNGDGYADVIVGADDFDGPGLDLDQGRAFVWLGGPEGLGDPVNADWIAGNDQSISRFGFSVGTAGDVNGDAFSDVIVGSIWFANGQDNEGRAYVYHGSAAGLMAAPIWTAEGDQVGAQFGVSVGTAGDVNGDGISDVIVGANLGGERGEGRAFVYLGSASGLAPNPLWTAESNQRSAGFGASVGTAGDVNGDGYADVIVGAPSFDNGQTNEGRAYVFHGSANGPSPLPSWTAESNQSGANFAYSVGTAGDVDGDGFDEVIVGAPFASIGFSVNMGYAALFGGSDFGHLTSAPTWQEWGPQPGASFGWSVGTAGDVNGDGLSDVIVGALTFNSGGQPQEGGAFEFHGPL